MDERARPTPPRHTHRARRRWTAAHYCVISTCRTRGARLRVQHAVIMRRLIINVTRMRIHIHTRPVSRTACVPEYDARDRTGETEGDTVGEEERRPRSGWYYTRPR